MSCIEGDKNYRKMDSISDSLQCNILEMAVYESARKYKKFNPS